jgi:hypothetical protein
MGMLPRDAAEQLMVCISISRQVPHHFPLPPTYLSSESTGTSNCSASSKMKVFHTRGFLLATDCCMGSKLSLHQGSSSIHLRSCRPPSLPSEHLVLEL